MRVFNTRAICSKCTSSKLTREHRYAGEALRVEDENRIPTPDVEFARTHETQLRRCVPCGWVWLERVAELDQVAAAERRSNADSWQNAAGSVGSYAASSATTADLAHALDLYEKKSAAAEERLEKRAAGLETQLKLAIVRVEQLEQDLEDRRLLASATVLDVRGRVGSRLAVGWNEAHARHERMSARLDKLEAELEERRTAAINALGEQLTAGLRDQAQQDLEEGGILRRRVAVSFRAVAGVEIHTSTEDKWTAVRLLETGITIALPVVLTAGEEFELKVIRGQ